MIEYNGEITSLTDLNNVSQSAQTNTLKLTGAFQYYRGHGCSFYKLISHISRFFTDVKLLRDVEEKIINSLKENTKHAGKQDYFYTPTTSNCFDEDWYWLTQAQHLGIPTRLLDWTLSSEIALYFTVSDVTCKDQDGDLWVFLIPDELNIYNQAGNISTFKPFQNDRDLFINIPVHWNKNYEKNEPQRNILSQQGKFFVRSYDDSLKPLEIEPYYQKYLLRYKVTSNNKSNLLKELNDLNYTEETIFKTIDPTMRVIKCQLLKEHNLIPKK
jgi:hypothetical protein